MRALRKHHGRPVVLETDWTPQQLVKLLIEEERGENRGGKRRGEERRGKGGGGLGGAVLVRVCAAYSFRGIVYMYCTYMNKSGGHMYM